MTDFLIVAATATAIFLILFWAARPDRTRLSEGELHASNERCRREYNRMRLHHPEKIAETIEGYVPAKQQESGWWDNRVTPLRRDYAVTWDDE